jgi:hypothetical protein
MKMQSKYNKVYLKNIQHLINKYKSVHRRLVILCTLVRSVNGILIKMCITVLSASCP